MGPPPLPGGVTAVLRFFFNLPQWFEIAGFIAGVLIAVVVVALLWRRRAAIYLWLVSRPRSTTLGLAAAVGVVALVALVAGAAGYHYVEHDNGFCTGCHVMNEPFRKFAGSKHDALECHDCHQQSTYASMRQLYLWVAERPDMIGMHAKVETSVCARCHVRGDAKETWQRIASTAGHRTHLESDSSALKNVQCVTCHGLEVHRFVPVNATCAQAGCHSTLKITLAKMKGQTDLHCVVCHRFTAEVPGLATRDSARGTLVPGMKQCLACHQMQAALAEFDPARDPHRGTCGMCHKPHTQTTSAEAAKTCTSSKCHADWRSDAFHSGANHRRVSENCILCHAPHHAKVDASDCAGCHTAVKERRGGKYLTPPLPFDTLKALQRVSFTPALHSQSRGNGPFFDHPPPGGDPRGADGAATDTFPHARHKQLSCITCHATQPGRGRLTFERPRGCQICHHQAPLTSNCGSCHPGTELARTVAVQVRVTVGAGAPREHPARFDHERHSTVACIACHTTQASLDPAPAVATCAACHDDHHAAGKQCAACHSGSTTLEVRAAHAPPVEAHVACGTCHAAAIVARLVPDRMLCITCHAPQREHYAQQECAVCHLQATHEAFRQ